MWIGLGAAFVLAVIYFGSLWLYECSVDPRRGG